MMLGLFNKAVVKGQDMVCMNFEEVDCAEMK